RRYRPLQQLAWDFDQPAPVFVFSSRRRHTRSTRDWSSDVCSSDLFEKHLFAAEIDRQRLTQADPDADYATLFVTSLERLVTETRSEERRVGKECRYRGSRCAQKNMP